MTASSSSLARIADLKAQIAKLESEAVQELRLKRESLAEQLAEVDAQLAELTGTPAEPTARRKAPVSTGRSIPLQELKEMLANAPEKTLNVRKEGLDLRNIKVLAEANPQLLKLGGKGPWPTVTLLK